MNQETLKGKYVKVGRQCQYCWHEWEEWIGREELKKMSEDTEVICPDCGKLT